MRLVLNNVQAVSFDLDDTLWDCGPVIMQAEKALFDWHCQHTPTIVQSHDLESLARYRLEVRDRFPELSRCVTTIRLAGLRSLLSEFDYPESLAEQGFEVFYNARSQVNLYDGALEMLAELKQHYRLVAITNGNADLDKIGIAKYFEQIYAADLTLAPKPAPDMFHRCLRELDIPACAMVHVGDNPSADIAGGQSAGVQTVWFNQYNQQWPVHLPAPDFEVKSVAEIASLFRKGRT